MLKASLATCVVALAAMSAEAQILEVDLSVPNQVTINATGLPSLVTASGSDTTGIYLENFYDGAGSALSATLVSGDFTNAENPSDGSPSLFRGGSGADPGLNVWSFSTDNTVTFTVGSTAFAGSATWSLDPAEYADMLLGGASGDVYFPADTEDDLANASNIGSYITVPEPAMSLLLSVAGLTLVGLRPRSRASTQSRGGAA